MGDCRYRGNCIAGGFSDGGCDGVDRHDGNDLFQP